MAEDEFEIECPGCGRKIAVTPRTPVRRTEKVSVPLQRARMAWSNKTGRFRRVMMTDTEWSQYRRRGSID